jgi:hypothetical protein
MNTLPGSSLARGLMLAVSVLAVSCGGSGETAPANPGAGGSVLDAQADSPADALPDKDSGDGSAGGGGDATIDQDAVADAAADHTPADGSSSDSGDASEDALQDATADIAQDAAQDDVAEASDDGQSDVSLDGVAEASGDGPADVSQEAFEEASTDGPGGADALGEAGGGRAELQGLGGGVCVVVGVLRTGGRAGRVQKRDLFLRTWVLPSRWGRVRARLGVLLEPVRGQHMRSTGVPR